MEGGLSVSGLRKRYGELQAVDDVSFDARTGEDFGLLGPNGAGKTTTLECILGLREPDAGSIRIDGIDARRSRRDVKRRIGAALQTTALPDRMTPREAIVLFAAFFGARAEPDSLLDQFGLRWTECRDQDVGADRCRLARHSAGHRRGHLRQTVGPISGGDDGTRALLRGASDRECRHRRRGAPHSNRHARGNLSAADRAGSGEARQSMSGLGRYIELSLRLHFRNRMALIYGYLFPTIFLISFWVLYRYDRVPLAGHIGELLTITVLGGACFGLPTTLVSERERGVWNRYRLSPVSTSVLIAGPLAARFVLLVLAAALQLVLALAIGFPGPQDWLGLWLAFACVAVAFMGLGLVIATLADNVPAVQALGQCVFLP